MKTFIKYSLFLFTLVMFASTEFYSQEADTFRNDMIFNTPETLPVFPGGNTALREWLTENTIYPNIPREGAIQGTVYIRFEASKTGEIGKIEIQRGIDPLLDNEAIKVVKLLPKFKPGMQNGEAVSCWMLIPIKYTLN